MKLTAVAQALQAAVTRLGIVAAVQVPAIQLAYELGLWIKRITRNETLSVVDGAGVLNEMFVSYFKKLTDNASIADDIATDFHKALRDNAGFTDVQIMDFFKILADEATVADVHQVALAKILVDEVRVTDDLDGNASILDEQTINFVKDRSELALVEDLFYRVVQFVRQFDEPVGVSEALRSDMAKPFYDDAETADLYQASVTKPVSDSASLTDDILVFDTGKFLNDNSGVGDAISKGFNRAPILEAFAVTDQPSLGSGLVKNDSALITDLGSLRSQGYCDLSYFEDDYVGAIRSF
jgi:hypothetical protein